MTRLLSVLATLACACGSSGSGGADASGGGGDDGGGEATDGLVAGPHTIELTLTNRPNNAAPYSFVVAYQDGGAPWKVAPAPAGDVYSFEVTAPSYGVMYACTGTVPGTAFTQARTVNLAHFAVAERTKVTLDVPQRCSDRFANTVTLSGSVTNRPQGGVIVVQYGNRTAFASNQTGVFAMQVPIGVHDLMVFHSVPEGNGDFYDDEAVTLRDFAVNGPTSKTIDFSTSQTMDYYDVTVDVMNARIVASTVLYTANGTQGTITREAGMWETDALPDALRRSTDVYDQSIAVLTIGHGSTITNATSNPGPIEYVAPPPLGDVTATISTDQPYPIVETAWSEYPEAVGYTWLAQQDDVCSGSTTCTLTWTAYLSPGVTGMSPSYRVPDLTTVTGWKAEYELVSAGIGGSVTAIRSTAGATDFPTGIPAAGTQRVFVRTDFDVAP
jgi:hypothetical protein